ncbi:MAG TPA: aminopeptidase P N-terminal domain-containing protein, partial [Gemmatimonadales bacterium]|nr:aminopeptidase P N-terminal domain-containing protein [Gemmatimonadales bacterium]
CAQSAAQSAARIAAAPALPIGAYTVVPELPGMGRPVDIAATSMRRRALMRRIGRGTVTIPAAHERNIEQDYVQDNDFRQDNTFYYFTELETQDAVLMMTARGPDSIETVLFLPARTPSQERWTGLRLGPDTTAVRLSGIATVLPIDSLDGRTRAAPQPVYTPQSQVRRGSTNGSSTSLNLTPIVDSMRVVKDADEIMRLRRAVDISVAGHIAAMRAARPGMYEYQIEAALEDGFRSNGADRVGYPSIVGSGPNSTTLHYDVNRRKTENGDLVVIDAAAEWGQYTADVTRTFPVNGKFTPRQKAIYDLVLGAQQAAFDSMRPGITMRELDAIARKYMREHSGDLCGQKTCDDREYFNHGLGHPIGMDVHDVGISRPLEPGMVVTLEPGIYLQAEKLGVRIEDDVLVTAKGGEWLSAGAPRTTDAIERLMAGR